MESHQGFSSEHFKGGIRGCGIFISERYQGNRTYSYHLLIMIMCRSVCSMVSNNVNLSTLPLSPTQTVHRNHEDYGKCKYMTATCASTSVYFFIVQVYLSCYLIWVHNMCVPIQLLRTRKRSYSSVDDHFI